MIVGEGRAHERSPSATGAADDPDHAPEAQLSAIARGVSAGSRLLVTGAGLAISAGLLGWRLRSGADPGTITPPGVGIPLPSRMALLVLGILAGGTGFAALGFLRQSWRVMHRLEFDAGVSPARIRAALSGSSLISTSPTIVTILCGSSVLAAVWVSAHGTAPLLFGGVAALYAYAGLLNSWVRWLDPDAWDSDGRSRLVRRSFRSLAAAVERELPTLEFSHASLTVDDSQLVTLGLRRIASELVVVFCDALQRQSRKRGPWAWVVGRTRNAAEAGAFAEEEVLRRTRALLASASPEAADAAHELMEAFLWRLRVD